MTSENSFVINVDSDTARYRSFLQHNNGDTTTNATHPMIARFSASTWTSNNREQELYAHQYPWIQHSVNKGKFGDAACALSHVRLLEYFLNDMVVVDYMFVFEDDAVLDPTFLKSKSIQAPNDADAILLSQTSTKLVKVPIQNHIHLLHATRVIQGYGMFGFVITKQGAKRLLELMQHRGNSALDVVLNSKLKTYHPIDDNWPLVHHGNKPSTRRKENVN